MPRLNETGTPYVVIGGALLWRTKQAARDKDRQDRMFLQTVLERRLQS